MKDYIGGALVLILIWLFLAFMILAPLALICWTAIRIFG